MKVEESFVTPFQPYIKIQYWKCIYNTVYTSILNIWCQQHRQQKKENCVILFKIKWLDHSKGNRFIRNRHWWGIKKESSKSSWILLTWLLLTVPANADLTMDWHEVKTDLLNKLFLEIIQVVSSRLQKKHAIQIITREKFTRACHKRVMLSGWVWQHLYCNTSLEPTFMLKGIDRFWHIYWNTVESANFKEQQGSLCIIHMVWACLLSRLWPTRCEAH